MKISNYNKPASKSVFSAIYLINRLIKSANMTFAFSLHAHRVTSFLQSISYRFLSHKQTNINE